MEIIQILLVVSILALQSYYDIRYKKVPLLVTVIGAVIGAVIFLLNKDFSWMRLCGFVPGIVCLLYAKLTREALGYGDGLLISMLGFYFKVEEVLFVCSASFILGGIVALILLVFFHKNGKQEMPFVPFMFFAVLVKGVLYVTA